MKKQKYRKTRRGRGWNKELNMSNNAAKAINNGFIKWNDYDKTYFIADEIECLHYLVSHMYVRHHFGNNKTESYMLPYNILDIIGDENCQEWKYYKEDYYQEANMILDIKQEVLKRMSIIDKLNKNFNNAKTDEEKNNIITSSINELTNEIDYNFSKKYYAIDWSVQTIMKKADASVIDFINTHKNLKGINEYE